MKIDRLEDGIILIKIREPNGRVRSKVRPGDIVVDLSEDGEVADIELVAGEHTTVPQLLDVLEEFGLELVQKKSDGLSEHPGPAA